MRFLLPFIILFFSACGSGNSTEQDTSLLNFVDCVALGNPVQESYPRKCTFEDGTIVVSQEDQVQIQKQLGCAADQDCTLINVENGFGCCSRGICDPVDHRESRWIAVNARWFANIQSNNCVPLEECGPMPACAPMPIVNERKAVCKNELCEKELLSKRLD